MKSSILIGMLAMAISMAIFSVGPLRAADVADANAVHPPAEKVKMQEALDRFAAALEVPSKSKLAPNPPAEVRFNNACIALEKGLEMPAGSVRQKLLPLAEQLLKDPDTAALDRVRALFVTGKYAEAETVTLRILNDGNALQLAGYCDMQLGDADRALIHFRSAASLVNQQRAPLDWAGIQRDIAMLLLNVGRLDEAENTWRRVLSTQLANLHAEDTDILNTRSVLAYTLSREGKFGDAAAQLREILTALEKTRGPNDIDTKTAQQNYERMLKASGGRR
jgi:tetratricopeptide (TPR) repeat protein